MSFELTGKLIVKEDTVNISDRFKKREFVIDVPNDRNPEWNDTIKFQTTQDRTELIEPFNLGDDILVAFNIKGNKWERDGKVNYFTNLEAWRIEKVGSGSSSTPGAAPLPDQPEALPPEEGEDDFPF
ncbi:DUF3127 domain-containing protein [Marinilabilia salmonicolor]|jgi:hypothetical protein|uniref:Uncharacterized protein DUF3127 n=1 Tax=Marinilabilia salmonicolor TaxID=989 RepID=A0A2T0XPG5_9BACT|nr:DUF3127 domain-containing protein [Marinilabilia salmonicolor]PRZ00848.1 uncharacterized protein DUF3127 [Marinilabilia salmonicolor]RCW30415.1 uncharacterized protein DUF3127 [Marinilabilia salmonicolor]